MIVTVPHSSIRPSPLNPRRRVDETSMAELAESIATEGLLQNLVVRRAGDGYELAAGERRWRAIAALIDDGHLPADYEVPVVVRDLTDLQLLQLATTENLARADMTPMEEARAFQRMLELDSDVDTIAAETGLSLATVRKRLALLKLTNEAVEALEEGELSLGAAQALTAASEDTQKRLLNWGMDVTASDVRRALEQGTVPVSRAKFPLNRYTGPYAERSVFDEDAEPRFADAELFHKLQREWAEELRDRYRQAWGWCEIDDYYSSWEYVTPAKGQPLKEQGVVIELRRDGELTVHEGLVKRSARVGNGGAGAEPERDPLALTKKHEERIHAELERAAQGALAGLPGPGLALLTYSLLQPYTTDVITIARTMDGAHPSRRLEDAHPDALAVLDATNLGPRTKKALEDPEPGIGVFDEELLAELLATPLDDLLRLVSVLVGLSLRAGEKYGTGKLQPAFAAIWRRLEPLVAPNRHLPTWRALGADWLALYRRARLQHVASRLCGPDVAAELERKPKKQAIAQILQRAGERLDQVPGELQLPDDPELVRVHWTNGEPPEVDEDGNHVGRLEDDASVDEMEARS